MRIKINKLNLKVNHFPKSMEITRKDFMHKNISKMQIAYGYKNFDFIPKSFILPNGNSNYSLFYINFI